MGAYRTDGAMVGYGTFVLARCALYMMQSLPNQTFLSRNPAPHPLRQGEEASRAEARLKQRQRLAAAAAACGGGTMGTSNGGRAWGGGPRQRTVDSQPFVQILILRHGHRIVQAGAAAKRLMCQGAQLLPLATPSVGLGRTERLVLVAVPDRSRLAAREHRTTRQSRGGAERGGIRVRFSRVSD